MAAGFAAAGFAAALATGFAAGWTGAFAAGFAASPALAAGLGAGAGGAGGADGLGVNGCPQTFLRAAGLGAFFSLGVLGGFLPIKGAGAGASFAARRAAALAAKKSVIRLK